MLETELHNKHYHQFTDNFYTKVPLANHLLVRKSYLTGNIRKTSEFISQIIKLTNIGVGESLYYIYIIPFYKAPCLFYNTRNAQPASQLYCFPRVFMRRTVSRGGNVQVKPMVIGTYNQHMGGVDSYDKSVYHVTCSRLTKNYWKNIVFNFLDMKTISGPLELISCTDTILQDLYELVGVHKRGSKQSYPSPQANQCQTGPQG